MTDAAVTPMGKDVHIYKVVPHKEDSLGPIEGLNVE